MQQRREIPPAQQLESLRKAWDHYRALADQIHHGEPQDGETQQHKWAREQNARRVAAAYENSFNTQNALLQGRH